ncbi:hypothetical protein KP509_30G064800 [Ceratopteris richardii]|uniref:Uncharacterized protein n=1 Tax=Ceratopteris richardii TaxID=49495 RepID=A0A8T2R4X9_CERRI|nr:hypothetical protein KP509_30G064800 [Ceratopteris richardii]
MASVLVVQSLTAEHIPVRSGRKRFLPRAPFFSSRCRRCRKAIETDIEEEHWKEETVVTWDAAMEVPLCPVSYPDEKITMNLFFRRKAMPDKLVASREISVGDFKGGWRWWRWNRTQTYEMHYEDEAYRSADHGQPITMKITACLQSTSSSTINGPCCHRKRRSRWWNRAIRLGRVLISSILPALIGLLITL